MDLDLSNQQSRYDDEYNHKLVANSITSFKISQNSYFTLRNNFNGFINLYKNWRVKAIQQLIKIENGDSFGNYFESFIYNWIAFNACYSFYRELDTFTTVQSTEKFDQEGTNIRLLWKYNTKNLQSRIMRVYAYESFTRLLKPNLSNLKDHERIKIEKLSNQAQTIHDFDKQKEDVTERIYWFVTYRLKRVRNNLFHGKKSHENIEDQAIVKDAAKLLNYFLYQFEFDFIQTIKERLIE